MVKEVIELLIKELKAQFDDFHGIYLYGIHLDGKLHKNEDIELVAIFDSEDKFKREIIWPIVGKIETELDVFIDLHPITMEELKKDEYLYEDAVENGTFYKA